MLRFLARRGSASRSLKYCRFCRSGRRSPSNDAAPRLVSAKRSCQPGSGIGFQWRGPGFVGAADGEGQRAQQSRAAAELGEGASWIDRKKGSTPISMRQSTFNQRRGGAGRRRQREGRAGGRSGRQGSFLQNVLDRRAVESALKVAFTQRPRSSNHWSKVSVAVDSDSAWPRPTALTVRDGLAADLGDLELATACRTGC